MYISINASRTVRVYTTFTAGVYATFTAGVRVRARVQNPSMGHGSSARWLAQVQRRDADGYTRMTALLGIVHTCITMQCTTASRQPYLGGQFGGKAAPHTACGTCVRACVFMHVCMCVHMRACACTRGVWGVGCLGVHAFVRAWGCMQPHSNPTPVCSLQQCICTHGACIMQCWMTCSLESVPMYA